MQRFYLMLIPSSTSTAENASVKEGTQELRVRRRVIL
jgi:hypothetical protein